ncbi:hypothetical protein DCC79_00885 [bacterium]|nr:hypothetical protein [Chloroflexi bacterium CFX6]RIL12631.1 MAG: hypothetical protein DCC79_00885 [bacterium]
MRHDALGVPGGLSHRVMRRPTPEALLDILAARQPGVRLDPTTARPWAAIAAAAHAHDVEPLVYDVVTKAGVALPDALGEHLRDRYYHTAAANAWLMVELARLIGALASVGIPVMLLKGAALVLTVYEHIGLRTLGDVDILVPPEHASAAIGAVRAHGYDLVVGNNELAERGKAGADVEAIVAFGGQATLRRQAPPHAIVDLHWTLVDRPPYRHRLPVETFWRSARPVTVGDAAAVVLSPEATVLHLCAHLALHHPDSQGLALRWLHDIAEVLVHQGDAFDWPALLGLAEACDLVLPLQRILPAVPAPGRIPSAVLRTVAALTPSADEHRAAAAVERQRHGLWSEMRVVLAYTPGWSMRARYVQAKLVPPLAYMRRRYAIRHPWLAPGYYVYRWLKAVRRAR